MNGILHKKERLVHPSVFFLFGACGIIAGVFSRSYLIGDLFFFSSILVIMVLIVLFALWRIPLSRVIVLFIICTIFGAVQMDHALQRTDHTVFAGQHFERETIIVKEPVIKERYQNIIVEIDDDQRALVRVDRYENIAYGDRIALSCILETPQNRDNGFDYRMYLAKSSINYQCADTTINFIAHEESLYGRVIALRQTMETNVNSVIVAPQAALANGLLFGGDDRLSEELQNAFSLTGMTHIVAVSGYNVTIIAQYLIIVGIALGLWRRQALWLSLAGIFLFVAMIGFPSSGVRAAIMGMLLLFALRSGRMGEAQNAIVIAGASMLLFNPLLLRYDIGFQLSFLATLGIILLFPLFDHFFVKRVRALGITEILFLTLCAQIFVVPIIIYNFHIISFISLLVNVLILPIIPITMLFVFIAAVVGSIFVPLAMVAGWFAHTLLSYEVAIISFFAQQEWSYRQIEALSIFSVILYYILLIAILIYLRKRYVTALP